MTATKIEQPSSLFERDFAAWLEQQAALLRAGRLSELDAANLAEELESMGSAQRRELDSRLVQLLMHMLKRDHQSQRRSRSWNATIIEQRRAIRRLLEDNPSLQRLLPADAADAYATARAMAAAETGLSASRFPAELPYSFDQVLMD